MAAPVFLKSAAGRGDFPPDSGREIAFVGRSNSGKSTAINAVLGVRKLARVSKTPGRTQLVNFFEIAPDRRIVDLPGYGFARVTEDVRERWRRLLDAYFHERRSLAAVLLTVDIRRGLLALDRDMLAWLAPLDLSVGVLLTKADKLGRGGATRQERVVAAELGARIRVVRFSALDGTGVAAARNWLEEWLGGAPVATLRGESNSRA